jgi:DNA-binding NtrC family response regulator
VALLRVLQEREFERVGGSETLRTDARVVAATNRNLEEAAREGSFRSDLFFRLNVFPIRVPALRERAEDIPILAEYWMSRHSRTVGKTIRGIDVSAMAALCAYPWPGNIRELKSVIESAVMVCDGEYMTITDLPMNLQHYATGHREEIGSRAIKNIEEGERSVIEDALRQTSGNKARAAEALGISTRTLYRKLDKFGLGG